jgi:hypothetical protein
MASFAPAAILTFSHPNYLTWRSLPFGWDDITTDSARGYLAVAEFWTFQRKLPF